MTDHDLHPLPLVGEGCGVRGAEGAIKIINIVALRLVPLL
jgi:hypothetical protein